MTLLCAVLLLLSPLWCLFLLYFRLLIDQWVLTLKGYITTPQIILKMSLVWAKFSFHLKLTSEWNHPFPRVPGLNNKFVRSATLGNNFSFTYLFQYSHQATKTTQTATLRIQEIHFVIKACERNIAGLGLTDFVPLVSDYLIRSKRQSSWSINCLHISHNLLYKFGWK